MCLHFCLKIVLRMTKDICSLVEASPLSLSPSRRVEVYHYGIFHLFAEGTLLRPISLGKKMWFVEGTSYFEISATSLRRNFDESSQFRRRFVVQRRHMDVTCRSICDETVTKLRRRRFVMYPLGRRRPNREICSFECS